MLIWHYSGVGSLAPWSPRFDARPLPPEVVGATEGPIARGAKAFYDRGCEYCHRIEGRGGIRGPDLSDVGDRLSKDQMKTRLFSGAANMPSYLARLRGAELDDLLAFLASRGGGGATLPPAR
jgi:ubiquinol-cytochrome c reductase cytochrome b subunit